MRLWRKAMQGCKYLVLRRDNTVPQWPYFVIGAKDPAAPAALIAYANAAEEYGFDSAYVTDIRTLAEEFKAFYKAQGAGDPDAGPHRVDDPEIIKRMPQS